MKPVMLQHQLLEPDKAYRRVLVHGSSADALVLLSQAAPLIGADAHVTWLQPPDDGDEGSSLRRLLGTLTRRGIRIVRDRHPDAPADVLERVRRDGHDLLLRALFRQPDGTGMQLQRLDRQLIEDCPCPLWLGDRGSTRPPRRILAAVAPDAGDAVATRLAREVLARADTVASYLGGELHIVHTWHLYGARLLRNRMRADELGRHFSEARRSAERAVGELLASLALSVRLRPEQVHVIQGQSEYALPRLVRMHHFDLAIVGTRGRRPWLANLLIKPHAREILEDAHCSVLVVR